MSPNISRSVIVSLVLVALVLSAPGCASIICGSEESVRVTSTPPGAMVNIKNVRGEDLHSGITPFTFTAKRGRWYFMGNDLVVSASVAGYPPYEKKHNVSLNPWYFGNVIFGGLIGLIVVDPLTGAMFSQPGEIKIDFAKIESEKDPLALRR